MKKYDVWMSVEVSSVMGPPRREVAREAALFVLPRGHRLGIVGHRVALSQASV